MSHLLVDEFQDLTPAHVLLVRLLAAPTYDVFGVGDDDQTIYSFAGADPAFLIDYSTFFPAARHFALEVNYRCPPAVVTGVDHLLRHNLRRVPKTIRSGRETASGRGRTHDGLRITRVPLADQAEATVDQLRSWHDDNGADWPKLAVLARVNSALLSVQVALAVEKLPHQSVVDSSILDRTGIRTALAYLRIGIDPGRIAPADVTATVGRPSRKVQRNVVAMLTNRKSTSIRDMRRLAKKLGGTDGGRLNVYSDDLETVVAAVKRGDTAAALAVIRDQIGLSSAMERLDQSRREADRSTHIDDLLALEQAARLHHDPGTFVSWLRDMLDRPSHPDGVHLSTIHKVKGREWDRVVVFGANEGLFPHRLATEIEEERRVFHVAVTRAAMQAVVMTDTAAPSPFVAELLGEVAVRPPRRAAAPVVAPPTSRKREGACGVAHRRPHRARRPQGVASSGGGRHRQARLHRAARQSPRRDRLVPTDIDG